MAVRHSQIDRLAAVKKEIAALNLEKERLESEIILSCTQDLENTKFKTVTYESDEGNRVTATLAETLKVICPSLLKSIFGAAYNDMVKEETKYTLTTVAKRMLTGIWTGSYVRQTVDEVLKQLPVDEATGRKLSKKLKGANFANDKKNLINIGGLSEQDASEYAYLLNEAAVWQAYITLLELNGITESAEIEKITKLIDTAMIVEESPKISLE